MSEIKEMFNSFPKTETNIDDLIDELLLIDDIRNFIIKNDLSHDDVVDGINAFLDYKNDMIINKDGKVESKTIPGFRPTLIYTEHHVRSGYVRIKADNKYKENIKYINFPKDLTNTSFNDYSLSTEERRKAYQYARRFINNFNTDEAIKGMYIAGSFRSGKTYLASAIANEIANKGYNVIEVYYPELSSYLKSQMNNEVENLFFTTINELKDCPLLILDDFGGESINPFIRDEALGVILNYRMEKKKPVIFTSNVPISKLLNTCLRKDGSETEAIKATRILERIKEITEEFPITERYIEKYNEDLF